MDARASAEARILELCALMDARMTELVSVAQRQESQIVNLESTASKFSSRLRVAAVRAGLQGYEDILNPPPPRPDIPVNKVQQLDVSEMRVRAIINREHPDFLRLPKLQPPHQVKRKPQVQRPITQAQADVVKRNRPDRPHDPALIIDWSPLLPSSKRKLVGGIVRPRPSNLTAADVSSRAPPKRPTREDKSEPSLPEPAKFKVSTDSSPDLSKYEKMQETGVPQGAIEQAMIQDGLDPALLFPSSSNVPKPSIPAVKPPPPPKRSSMEDYEAKTESTAAEGAASAPVAKKPPPPPKRNSFETGVAPESTTRKSDLGPDQQQVQPPKIPPIPRRTSAEETGSSSDVQPQQPAVKKPMPPPVPRRSSMNDMTPPPSETSEASTSKATVSRRNTAGEVSETAALKPPPVPIKQTSNEEESASTRTKSTGGLAARQAMLANMLGGGGGAISRPSSTGPSSVGGDEVPSRAPSALPPPKKEEVKPPKSLSDDADLANAAGALEKKLLGGASSKSKDISKYQKMQKAGLPQGAIEHAMRKDGVDPKLLFG